MSDRIINVEGTEARYLNDELVAALAEIEVLPRAS